MNHGLPPTKRNRALMSLLIGTAAGIFAYWHLAVVEPSALGFDFTWPWRAARMLLAGQNPYELIRPTGDFPFNAYFKYPLPAAVLAIPFAWMTAAAAAATFGGISTALLAYGMTELGWGRLIILLSTAYVTTLFAGQWSTVMMAAALLPGISWVAVCKPTVGLASFVYRPNRWAIIGSIMICLIGIALLPTWPVDWLRTLRVGDLANWYRAPVTLIGGQLLLLSALRWRRSEARWLLAISITPHVLGFYTGFLPMLVARSRREALFFAVASAVAGSAAYWWTGDVESGTLGPALWGYWLLVFIYLPALVMVLRRPNEADEASAWVVRLEARMPKRAA